MKQVIHWLFPKQKNIEMRWLKKGLCGMDLHKQTYIVAVFDLLVSAAIMVMGFVVIIYPEKYIRNIYCPSVRAY